MWMRGFKGMFGGGIHGEFVTPKQDGGFQTIATQSGEVTAVSSDSLTVKSEDGFSRTYTLGSDTRVNAGREGVTAVKTGDQVSVFATVEGSTATGHGRRHDQAGDGQGLVLPPQGVPRRSPLSRRHAAVGDADCLTDAGRASTVSRIQPIPSGGSHSLGIGA